MDNAVTIQEQLFNSIKSKITAATSAVDDIAAVLEISTDSAYRRIRGEKNLSLDEINKLCNHYHISLDRLLSIETGAFLFHGQLTKNATFRFEDYLKLMMHTMAYYNSCREKEVYYLCKDIPIFHHYHFKEIAAFKYYFWMRTFLGDPSFVNRPFSFTDYPDELFALNQKILALYNQLPSHEVWNLESINNMLHQVEYYRESHLFHSDEDAYILYETFEKLINHLEKQAALGYKFSYGDPDQKPLAEFNMYFNEVIIGDNNLLIVLDGVKTSLVSHNIFNYMETRDAAFNEYTYTHVRNLIRRSTLISSVSEKERNRFFRVLREKIANRKKALV
jgi:hypothetical protein